MLDQYLLACMGIILFVFGQLILRNTPSWKNVFEVIHCEGPWISKLYGSILRIVGLCVIVGSIYTLLYIHFCPRLYVLQEIAKMVK